MHSTTSCLPSSVPVFMELKGLGLEGACARHSGKVPAHGRWAESARRADKAWGSTRTKTLVGSISDGTRSSGPRVVDQIRIGAHRAHSRLPATGVEEAALAKAEAKRGKAVSQLGGQGREHVVHDPGKADELEIDV